MEEEDKATGVATCLRSGNCLHIVIPKHVQNYLSLKDRYVVKIKLSLKLDEEGKPLIKPVKRHDLKKHLIQIPTNETDTKETAPGEVPGIDPTDKQD
ncbi:hypothetical protein LCGC14_2323710 [marine sediment metagenome]|uniref:Uncharacterized protein n=1 Tax=marine sediment metagenome TaxID=412755 RepID=A0A0F9EUG0_9ZZZZ